MENKEENIENQDVKSEDETQTVGDILRHARLKKGKTLNDVATELCIRRAYLEAIENVDYNSLPVEPYRLGYVRNYAEYLGLNGARIVQSFKETALPKNNGKKGLKAIGEEFDSNGPKIKHVILGIFALCLIAIGGYFYKNYAKEPLVEIVNEAPLEDVYPAPVILDEVDANVDAKTIPNDSEEEQKTDSDEITEEENAQTDENEQTENEAEEKFEPRIKFVLTGDSWIELKHGKEVLLAKVYHKGFEYEIPYNDDLEISVGKHGNVKFYIDGKPTTVATAKKQLKIKLDKFLEKR